MSGVTEEIRENSSLGFTVSRIAFMVSSTAPRIQAQGAEVTLRTLFGL